MKVTGETAGGSTGPRVSFRLVLSRRDFFRVWLSQAVSYVGDRFTQVALFLYVLDLYEGSAGAAGLLIMVQCLPLIIFGSLAGVFVDRWDKRRTMVACDLVRAAIIAVVPFLAADTRLFVFVVAFLMQTATTFFTPALQASVPELLERRDEILVANSLMYSTKYFTDIVGFSLAGIAVAAIGVKIAFVIDAVTFLFSAWLLVGIGKRLVAGAPRPGGLGAYWEDLKEGIRYHRTNPVVFSLLVSFTLGVLAMGGLNALLVVAVEKILRVEEYWWGFLLSAQAVTMFATAAAIGRWGQRAPKPGFILAGFLGVGLSAIGLSATRSLVVAFLLYGVVGAANAAFLVPSITWLQEIVPFEIRGRVLGLRNMVVNLAAVVSAGVIGPLGDSLGLAPAMAGVGVFLCLTALASSALPGFRGAFRRPPAELAA